MDEELAPTHYYVVSDSHGFVGAFYSAASAAAEINKYQCVPFLVQQFPIDPGFPTTTIWVVLYRDLDAVAFVSNSRDEAVQIQKYYIDVGLSYIDSIDYWEHPVNKISKSAAERLKSLSRAHAMYIKPDSLEDLQRREQEDCARIDRLVKSKLNGPIARLLRETEKISIIEGVIPTGICVDNE